MSFMEDMFAVGYNIDQSWCSFGRHFRLSHFAGDFRGSYRADATDHIIDSIVIFE